MTVFGVTLFSAGASMAETQPDRCWTPQALASRAEEKPPRRGAPGHARSIPKVALQPFQPVAADMRGSIRRVSLPPGRKLIALTFDLCEQPGEIAGYDGPLSITFGRTMSARRSSRAANGCSRTMIAPSN